MAWQSSTNECIDSDGTLNDRKLTQICVRDVTYVVRTDWLNAYVRCELEYQSIVGQVCCVALSVVLILGEVISAKIAYPSAEHKP